jgi:spore germination protein YaaH
LTITPVLPKDLDRVILGYYIPGEQAYGSMLEHSTKLTAAAPLGWTLDSYGGLSADFDPQEMGRSLYFAGNQELETFAHVQVASHPTRLLTSSYLKQNTISQLVSTVEEWGLKGILLNIAYVPGAEQPELFAFLESLSAELQAKGLRTLVGLPLSADIDYQAASGSVDYVVLYSALQKDGPGPLAALPELESQLSAITQAIDSRKIILALSTSALDWSRTGSAQVLSHGEVLELAAQQGAKVRWDPVSMTPYFHYGNGGEVWFENRYSLKHKLELVAKYQLGGAALANLGQEDPELWNSVEDLLVG